MSTANFHNKNASLIYAGEIEDEFDYEDLLCNLRAAFRSAAADPRKKAFATFEEAADSWEPDGLRSYPGRIIGRVESRTKSYRDFDIALCADIIVRSGYYAGVNLDYELRLRINGDDIDEDGLEDALDDQAFSERQREYHCRLARQWLDRNSSAFAAAIERLFAQYSTPLRLVARASNGEAFYERA